MVEINESGMEFGPFEDGSVFLIEKSEVNKNAGENIRTVEFVYTPEPLKLCFVEAKSSSPNPVKSSESFEQFIVEITEKFIHSFNLYYAILLERYDPKFELGNKLKGQEQSKVVIRFYLIIKGHEIDWLPPIKAELERKLYEHRAIWKSDIIVLNDVLAKQVKLIHN